MPNVQRSKELRPFQAIGRTKKKVGVYGGMGKEEGEDGYQIHSIILY